MSANPLQPDSYEKLFEVRTYPAIFVRRTPEAKMRLKICGCVVRWNPNGSSYNRVELLSRAQGCSRVHYYVQDHWRVYAAEKHVTLLPEIGNGP